MNRDLKICIVSSCGGHLSEIRTLSPVFASHEHFYVLNDRVMLPNDMRGRTYLIRHAERDLILLINFWEAWRILRREHPSVILSAGAGLVVPFALVGKILGIPTIFIETAAKIATPSLTGRVMYYIADRFFYQWPSLGSFFPRGTYGGLLL